jgi:hypothetical protein
MASHSRTFSRLLLVATAINVIGLPLAIVQSEPMHATWHAGLALICGFWALRLRHPRPTNEPEVDDYDPADPASAPAELGTGDQASMNDEWLRRKRAAEQQERRE